MGMMLVGRLRGFLGRQSHNYRVLLLRNGGHNFFLNLTSSYDSVYTMSLGADPVTLGSMSGLGSAVNTAVSMPSGWLSDVYGLKRALGLGMAVYVVMVSMYAFALDWTWVLVAMVLSPVTMALLYRSQEVMMVNGLRDGDRATGLGLNHVVINVMGLLSPIPAALLVERFGGLTVDGIRPVYLIRLAGVAILYLVVYMRLTPVPPQPRGERGAFLGDFKRMFEGRSGLRAYIAAGCLGAVMWGMLEPFTLLYAVRVKGASALTLGAMTTISTLLSVLVALPVSRLADRRGRKFVVYLTRPFLYLSLLLTILAPDPSWLIAAWVLRGFFMGGYAWETLGLELVPPGQRGRWLGVVSTTSSVFRIPAPILGGILFDRSPDLLFVVPIIIDLLRIPIIIFKVPETARR